ncbi:SlyX family protein [Aestuariibacter sp. AA17]|uniref:Protein SlyX homolog n=1 Tax=Fluctibacter corallii TaxID=2984329 RepID=A0ABT3AAW5_9ALTE|nr:SlyX family protein [Aestuariibacter sp. AA17]MCV2885821.1 SlyX family protein [Aestuariibacter sp. AA17]
MTNVEDRLEELEMKVAFQENTIESLNDALASQQIQIEKLEFQLRHVVERVKQLKPSNIASEAEETPPPHY